jgi:lauroyl/myristoyl acyltransferase
MVVPRLRGWSLAWRGACEAASRRALAIACRAAARLPQWALPAAAWVAAALQVVLSPRRAREHYRNLGLILPAAGASWHRRLGVTVKALRSFGLFVLEFLKTSRMSREEVLAGFTFEGLDELSRALEKGRGAVLVTSHIGNWEAGALALAGLGYKLHVVAAVQFSRWLSPHVKALKRSAGVGVVSPGPGAYRRLVDALRANEAVALVVDGDTFERGIEVPFFRGRLRAPAGPARLAVMTGASVISTHVVRRAPLRFDMAFKTLWDGAGGGLLARDDPGFVHDLTCTIMAEQERAIEKHLDQWCIFRPLWEAQGERNGAR